MADKIECKTNENENTVSFYIEDDFEYFGHLKPEISQNIIWKRVSDINEDPCLLENYNTYIDGYVICGSETVSWYPVLYTILRCNSLKSQVLGDIEMKDSYNRTIYDGSFVFSFYGRNQWVEIRIDDRLPFFSDSQKNIFATSSNKEEFLPSLLEKAYARYLGGYGKFQSIDFLEALMNLTGGLIEEVPLRRGLDPMTIQEQKFLFRIFRSLTADTIILCHTSSDCEYKATSEHNLPGGHYYVVKGSASIPVKSRSNVVLSVLSTMTDFSNKVDMVDLIRLHNPVLKGDWGGSYNLGSQEWESMSEYVRRHYNLKFEHEFEFWISMNDLCKQMSASLLCHIPNERVMDALLKSVAIWYPFYEHGHYGCSVPGGSLDYVDNKFLENDQYLIDVINIKEVTIKAVLQVETTDRLKLFKDGCGVVILKVENNRCYRLHEVKNIKSSPLKILSATGSTITVSMSMSHGRYVLIPWRKSDLEIEYYLRIYSSQKSIKVTTLTEDQPPFVDCFKCSLAKTFSRCKESIMTTLSKESNSRGRPPRDKSCVSCVAVNPADAIRLTLVGAQNLESRCNSYFVLKCGNYSYKSTVKSLTNSPNWNEDFIFYRVDPTKEAISVELFYEERFGFDKSVGVHILNQYEISRAQDGEEIIVSLCIMNDKEMVPTTTKVGVKLRSYSPGDFNTI